LSEWAALVRTATCADVRACMPTRQTRKCRRESPCTGVLMIFGAVAACLILASIPVRGPVRGGTETPLPEYCSAGATGTEGIIPGWPEGFALRAAVVTIRHGDRSAIFAMPGANATPRWQCDVPTGEAGRAWARLPNVFGVYAVRGGHLLNRQLHSKLAPEGHCAPGQLTPTGFEQHHSLGRHLSRAYRALVDEMARAVANGSSVEAQLYTRSTDYTRTQMSAAALVSGLLMPAGLVPRTLRREHQLPLRIWSERNRARASRCTPRGLPSERPRSEESEADDFLHGVGLSSSSKVSLYPHMHMHVHVHACACACAYTYW